MQGSRVQMNLFMDKLLNEMKEACKTKRDSTKYAKQLHECSSFAHDNMRKQMEIINSLEYEIRDKQQHSANLEKKVEEYEVIIDCLYDEYNKREHEFNDIINYIDQYYHEEAVKYAPKCIIKHYMQNKGRGMLSHLSESFVIIYISGKTATRMPHVNKLIVAMLVNQTLPSSIQVIIHAMSQTLHYNINIVKEIPSLNHIKNLRTTLL